MPVPNHSSSLPELSLPEDCNYAAVFLTMASPYRCGDCSNEPESPRKKEDILRGSEWVRGLRRLTALSFEVERRKSRRAFAAAGG